MERAITGIGQDSHAFEKGNKPLKLGGVTFDDCTLSLRANSDGDVVLHAITNAVSGITCKNILGKVADKMCLDGTTDSSEYLKVALSDIKDMGGSILHISVSIECAVPKISPYSEKMRDSIASLCDIDKTHVGITATTGEGLTPFGQSLGISVFAAVTALISF